MREDGEKFVLKKEALLNKILKEIFKLWVQKNGLAEKNADGGQNEKFYFCLFIYGLST